MTEINTGYVKIGIISGFHGLDGTVKVKIYPEIEPYVKKDWPIIVNLNGFFKKHIIQKSSPIKRGVIALKLSGLDNRESASILINSDLFITEDEAGKIKATFDEDTFYYFDLIGKVVLKDNKEFGEVIDVFNGGSGEIILIKSHDNKEYMVPFVKSMVDTSDLQNGVIKITPVEGLLEEQ